MRLRLFALMATLCMACSMAANDSGFVREEAMMADLLQMLANFSSYAKDIYTDTDSIGYFKGNSAGKSNEDGVRTNADLAMVCAFVATLPPDEMPKLPAGVSEASLRNMALKALRYGYSTHKANRLRQCTNKAYWGSVSKDDNQWESSLWTMSLAFAAYFLDADLTDADRSAIHNMIKAECDYELERDIPTGFDGDTKAEENGWEANVLACALGLYPNDALAPQWFDRLRLFAINCYSHSSDSANHTVIDPEYDGKTVADLYCGPCLYDDYTLQNHNYFHTSYQNVVMQELGESHLALALFQGANQKWRTNALMHNNQKVMDEVLRWLALADGELAMPNGNDWSMFLFDQITSYSTAACFLRDADALMLENLAYKNIKARQATTADGSWLLNSDIGPRRMGVQAHRVMMTYLMHRLASTENMQPTDWGDFSRKTATARLLKSQNIVRASTPSRYSIFSWSKGLKNYTGYFVPNNADIARIVVPYKANGTGNLLGWYKVDGRRTDAAPIVSGNYSLKGNSYVMNGRIATNEGALTNAFAIYSTPGNALIYVDRVTASDTAAITAQMGGLLAISVDPFTKTERTITHSDGRLVSDGTGSTDFQSQWVNIDDAIGVAVAGSGNTMWFGGKSDNNSISTAKLSTCYSADTINLLPGDEVDSRAIAYYSGVSADITKALASETTSLAGKCAKGWNGAIAADPDGARYMLLSNFGGAPSCALHSVATANGSPVFSVPAIIDANGTSVTFTAAPDSSIAEELRVYITSSTPVCACLVPGKTDSAIISSASGKAAKVSATIISAGKLHRIANIIVPAQGSATISL